MAKRRFFGFGGGGGVVRGRAGVGGLGEGGVGSPDSHPLFFSLLSFLPPQLSSQTKNLYHKPPPAGGAGVEGWGGVVGGRWEG